MQYIIILKAVKIFLTSERKCILVCWLLMAWFQNCYTVLHKCTVRQCTIGNKSTVRTFLISIDTSPRISQLSFRFLANFCFQYTVVNFLNFFCSIAHFFIGICQQCSELLHHSFIFLWKLPLPIFLWSWTTAEKNYVTF